MQRYSIGSFDDGEEAADRGFLLADGGRHLVILHTHDMEDDSKEAVIELVRHANLGNDINAEAADTVFEQDIDFEGISLIFSKRSSTAVPESIKVAATLKPTGYGESSSVTLEKEHKKVEVNPKEPCDQLASSYLLNITDDMQEELSGCKHCKGVPFLRVMDAFVQVLCSNCFISGPLNNSAESAAKDWNELNSENIQG